MPKPIRLRLGRLLVDAGVLTSAQVQQALDAQLIHGGRLGTNLIELGLLSEEFLTKFLSQQCNVAAVGERELEDIPFPVIQTLSSELAERHRVVPFRIERHRLDVAIVDPTNLDSLDELVFRTRHSIRPHVVPEVVLLRALERYYGIPRVPRHVGSSAPDAPAGEDAEWPTAETFIPAAEPDPAESPEPDSTPAPPVREALPEAIRCFKHAETIQGIFEGILRFSRPYFSMRLMFGLRSESFDLIVQEGVEPPLAGLSVPIREPNLFYDLAKTKGHHLGTLPPDPDHLALLERLGQGLRATAFMAPLVYQGRAEIMLLGLGPRRDLSDEDTSSFQVMLEKADLALRIMAMRKRLEVLPEKLG